MEERLLEGLPAAGRGGGGGEGAVGRGCGNKGAFPSPPFLVNCLSYLHPTNPVYAWEANISAPILESHMGGKQQ